LAFIYCFNVFLLFPGRRNTYEKHRSEVVAGFSGFARYIFFTGCSKKPAKAEENTQIQISSTPQQDFDLGGYTVRIAQWWDASPNDRSSIARHKAAEEKYNCKIEYITITWDQIVSKFTSSVLSGEPIADIVLFEMTRALPVLAESDLIIPVDDYFDFNDRKWPL